MNHKRKIAISQIMPGKYPTLSSRQLQVRWQRFHYTAFGYGFQIF